ncbi:hemerythrin domain-containing protein [Anaeromyxobacter oryzisoli]|uniref:hemerythrin domain-containing protein n=1 Tax=Anaeromyxobacter oryzisoli TaxID=2925408 RepID=UPI0038CC171F
MEPQPPRAELPSGLELRGSMPEGWEEVLTPGALAFVVELVRTFRPRVEGLLERRADLQRRRDAGERLDFLAATAELRAADWTAAPIPADLQDRRVELTGPVDRDGLAAALGSGATGFVADLEDATSPTWRNVVEAQLALAVAAHGATEQAAPGGASVRRSGGRSAVLMVRPRGWHRVEEHVLVDGRAAPAALWDFGVHFWRGARALVAKGSGPYFELAKLEDHLEARLWNDVFVRAQARVGLPRGTVRATCAIETLPAAFEMDEILWELREHAAGLSCGRASYVRSFVERLGADPRMVLPDPASIPLGRGFLRAHARLLVQTCHRRGVHALGGPAARLLAGGGPGADARALAAVRACVLREVADGHDGTRVAHPGLVPVARAIFDERVKTPNPLRRRREAARVTADELLRPPQGARTEAGLRLSVRASIRILAAWLHGSGRIPLHGVLEDVATAELSCALAWQWIHHGAPMEDGQALTVERLRTIVAEEVDRIRLEVGDARFAAGRFEEARALFERASTGPELGELLTVRGYGLLEASPAQAGPAQADPRAASDAAGSAAPAHPDPRRWEGIVRGHGRADVERLRGSVRIELTLARMGAERLWALLHSEPYVNALCALTGGQAAQMVKAGFQAVHAGRLPADANADACPGRNRPGASSIAERVRRINRALQRADQREHAEGRHGTYWFAPVVAGVEAGAGRPLDAFERVKDAIEAGAAAVHLGDEVASAERRGRPGGKVLVPTSTFVRTLTAARLAADVADVPTVLVARTVATGAALVTSDADPRDAPFLVPGERSAEGFHRFRGGLDAAIARGLAYAPHADLIWCEALAPDLHEARRFAEGIHARFPGKLLAYDCAPLARSRRLDAATGARFQRELCAMGYRLQLATLAGLRALDHSARRLEARGMAAFAELRQRELEPARHGSPAGGGRRAAGAGYLARVAAIVAGGGGPLARDAAPERVRVQRRGADRAPPTHGVEQVQRAVEADHARLRELVLRIERSTGSAAISAALDELFQQLSEHFAHEEHAKGLYGLLATNGPGRREELARMADEHRQILGQLAALLERTRGPGSLAAGDLGPLAAELTSRIMDHEARESRLVDALA